MTEPPDAAADFAAVFAQLRLILQAHAPPLLVAADEPGIYYLNTSCYLDISHNKNKQPLFFGMVEIKKNYVSFHLFPVYVHPELLDTVSPKLRARMQGKSCFNFKKADPALFTELARLTQAGYAAFAAKGWI